VTTDPSPDPSPDVVLRDATHALRRTDRPDRFVVATRAGRRVGVVYYTTRGYRCWRDGEPTLVAGLRRALAHYRDDAS
jgi:hypothetical protein